MSKKVLKDELAKPNRLTRVELDEVDMKLSHDISQLFKDFAVLLKMDKANHFRVKAVQNASEIVKTVSLDEYLKDNRLKAIKGVGKELSEKIVEFHTTGICAEIEQLKSKHPTWNAPKFDWSKKIDHSATAKYYWCFDAVDTEEIYGPENWSEEDAREYGRPNVFVIIPRTKWDEQRLWDDGSAQHKQLFVDLKTLFGKGKPEEETECIFSWHGTVEDFRKIMATSPLFHENEEIAPDNEDQDYDEYEDENED